MLGLSLPLIIFLLRDSVRLISSLGKSFSIYLITKNDAVKMASEISSDVNSMEVGIQVAMDPEIIDCSM